MQQPAQQEREQSALAKWWNSKAMKRFRRNPLAITGALIVLFFVVVAISAPLITTPGRSCLRDLGLSARTVGEVNNPLRPAFWRLMFAQPLPGAPLSSCYTIPRTTFSPVPQPPTSESILGTSSRGYDIYYGLVWGTRTAFFIGFLVIGVSLSIGLLIGSIAGYFGGWIDNVLMRFTDVIISVPSLIMAIVIVTILGQSLVNIMLAIAIVGWPTYARLLRGDILRVKEQEYVDGARALGAGNLGIIFKHVLPNSIGSIIIVASLDIGTVVITAAALSFLGLGPPIGFADWGQMIAFARDWILGPPNDPFAYWYVSFYPGIVIVLFVLGWNLLGDAFRDVNDPRSGT